MNSTMIVPPCEVSPINCMQLFQSLHSLQLTREDCLKRLHSFLQLNAQTSEFNYHQLQKLWIKLLKKYKFTLNDWQTIDSSLNIPRFFIPSNGDGLLSMMRFYKDRALAFWRENLFFYATEQLVYEKQLRDLELYL